MATKRLGTQLTSIRNQRMAKLGHCWQEGEEARDGNTGRLEEELREAGAVCRLVLCLVLCVWCCVSDPVCLVLCVLCCVSGPVCMALCVWCRLSGPVCLVLCVWCRVSSDGVFSSVCRLVLCVWNNGIRDVSSYSKVARQHGDAIQTLNTLG